MSTYIGTGGDTATGFLAGGLVKVGLLALFRVEDRGRDGNLLVAVLRRVAILQGLT